MSYNSKLQSPTCTVSEPYIYHAKHILCHIYLSKNCNSCSMYSNNCAAFKTHVRCDGRFMNVLMQQYGHDSNTRARLALFLQAGQCSLVYVLASDQAISPTKLAGPHTVYLQALYNGSAIGVMQHAMGMPAHAHLCCLSLPLQRAGGWF
jgi:hypothetical protein